MRVLSIHETGSVSAGASDLTSFTANLVYFGNQIQSILKSELIFGAVGLALLLAPAGWSMTALGAVVGAGLGLGFSYIKTNMN